MLQAGKFMPQSTRNSLRQTVISWFLLILLVFIAVVIGFKQKSYQKPGSDSAILSADLFGSGFTAAEDIENYNSGSLYEKIDGKADLYLGNGFVSLQCRRFADSSAIASAKADNSAKDHWAEVYLYDMADGENAFAVYSLQKRSDSTPLDWAQFGYSTSDSVYAAFGKYYMEIILSSQDNSLLTSALNAAKQLSSAISAGKTQMPVFDLFPTENLVADSFKFINADAFSCSDLKNIFTANYKISGNDITAYLSKNSPADTYAKYYRFLIDNGAKDLQHTIKLSDSKAVELFGTNEIFFVTGGFFAGVRASAPIDDLQKLAEKLIENLSKQK
jgi:hypothetical protein